MLTIRTEYHIISDLLNYLRDHQWEMGRDYDGHGCCPDCEKNTYQTYLAQREDGTEYTARTPEEDLKHKENCCLDKLIKEATAVVAAENEVRRERGEELIKP